MVHQWLRLRSGTIVQQNCHSCESRNPLILIFIHGGGQYLLMSVYNEEKMTFSFGTGNDNGFGVFTEKCKRNLSWTVRIAVTLENDSVRWFKSNLSYR